MENSALIGRWDGVIPKNEEEAEVVRACMDGSRYKVFSYKEKVVYFYELSLMSLIRQK